MTREEFMDIVYSELHSDGDNNRANRIIDAADEYEETERKSVLGKIRAEIEKMSTDYCGGYVGLDKKEVLQIIDKYSESEVEE